MLVFCNLALRIFNSIQTKKSNIMSNIRNQLLGYKIANQNQKMQTIVATTIKKRNDCLQESEGEVYWISCSVDIMIKHNVLFKLLIMSFFISKQILSNFNTILNNALCKVNNKCLLDQMELLLNNSLRWHLLCLCFKCIFKIINTRDAKIQCVKMVCISRSII